MITKMHHTAFMPPEVSLSRNRSPKTLIGHQNQMIHMNRTNIVMNTPPRG